MLIDKNKLTGLNDILFKVIMYPNIHIMKKVLESILDRKLNNIKYLGQELPVVQFIEKGKRLDAFVKSTNEYIDIEVSTKFTKYISWRNYAFASQVYTGSIKREDDYSKYKHTYLINLIGNRKGKIPIRKERHLDEINEEMTNAITEVQVNIDYLIKEYYNKDNQELTNEYKYLIMLGLTLEELEKFRERYDDEIVTKYEEEMKKVLDDEEIEPLFTFKEDLQMQVKAAKVDGIEIGEKRGEKNKTIELAKNFKTKGIDLKTIAEATGLSMKKLMML